MYILDVLPFGIIALVLYIVMDIIKHRAKDLVRRIVFYSFLFYLINVLRVTTGGISLRPFQYSAVDFQLVPFSFIMDWIKEYNIRGFNWFFWNSVKLSALNVVMLIPLGIYLPVLFNIRNAKNVLKYSSLASLTIEIYQVILSYYGLLFMVRTFNVDDIILNTLGSIIGLFLYKILIE